MASSDHAAVAARAPTNDFQHMVNSLEKYDAEELREIIGACRRIWASRDGGDHQSGLVPTGSVQAGMLLLGWIPKVDAAVHWEVAAHGAPPGYLEAPAVHGTLDEAGKAAARGAPAEISESDGSTDDGATPGTPITVFVLTLTGKTLTLHADTADKVITLKRKIAAKDEGLRSTPFRLIYDGKSLRDGHTLGRYQIRNESVLNTLGYLLAGAPKPKVIKTVIKTRTSTKTVAQDRATFESAYNMAVATHASTKSSLDDLLANADLADLEKLREYLKHDKTKRDIKIAKIVEYSKSYRTMEAIQQKMTMAMDHLNDMLQEDLYNSYADDMGNINMDIVIEKVTSQIAVMQDRADRDDKMKM